MSETSTAQPAPTALEETPDIHGAYPRLSDAQIAILERGGTRREVAVGDILIRQGGPTEDFIVILSGRVAIITEDEPGKRQIIRVHGSRRFLGGTLAGEASFFTAEVIVSGTVLTVPAPEVRSLVGHEPALSDLILRAYLVRRCLLMDEGVGLRIIGSGFSPDTARLREFAARNRIPHRWFDLERDAEAERLFRHFGLPPADTPVVVWGDDVLRNPTNTQLARLIGLPVPDVAIDHCDLIVVGAGLAGLAAAVYGSSDGLRTSAMERIAPGGQAGTTSRIENYLGFPAGISGAELAERAILQAGRFGARIAVSAEANLLESDGGQLRVGFTDGGTIVGRAVVLATGARYRKLAVPGMEALEGNGVYYAATHQEALLCGNGPVAIVGAGNSAGQAAVFLADRVFRVHLLVRGDDLTKSMSRYLVDQIERHPRVSIHLHSELREVRGSGMLRSVVAEDNRTGERLTIATHALFVFIGALPNTLWLRGTLTLDDHGFIPTGSGAALHDGGNQPQTRRRPMTLETSMPGVFAAGDVRSGSVKRVAAAVGEGSMAIREVYDYLLKWNGPTTLEPRFGDGQADPGRWRRSQ